MKDLILAVILAVIIGLAIAYIVKQKRKGIKCIGCPDADKCSKSTEKISCAKCKRKRK